MFFLTASTCTMNLSFYRLKDEFYYCGFDDIDIRYLVASKVRVGSQEMREQLEPGYEALHETVAHRFLVSKWMKDSSQSSQSPFRTRSVEFSSKVGSGCR